VTVLAVRGCGIRGTAEGDLPSAQSCCSWARGRRHRRPDRSFEYALASQSVIGGIPWLGRTCGICRFCASGREIVCLAPTFTGWDRDGCYSSYPAADEAFACALPFTFRDLATAPFLCVGIIGWRALVRADLPVRRAPRSPERRRLDAPRRAGRGRSRSSGTRSHR
jgi:hypothetical protein